MCSGQAFNPFNDWGDKKWWEKVGFSLPIGSNVGSPKWVKENPREAMTAAAIAATVLTMGAASPAIGAAAGAGAAGVGAGVTGLGAAEGAGLMGLGGAASGFAPTAAGAGLLGTYAGPAAATPFFTGGAEAIGAGMGGMSMFGPAAGGASMLGALEGPGAGLTAPWWANSKDIFGKGLKGLQNAQKLQKLAQGPEQQMAPPMRRPQQQAVGGQELAQLSALFSNPVGQQQLQRLLAGLRK